jgi:hypothetical protein
MIDLEDYTGLDLVGVGLVVLALALVAAILLWSVAGQTGSGTPDTSWNLTRLNDTHVTVTHASGDSVRASQLTVLVNETARPVEWSATVVSEGDDATVRVSAGTTLRLLWRQDGGEPTVLYRWDSVP